MKAYAIAYALVYTQAEAKEFDRILIPLLHVA